MWGGRKRTKSKIRTMAENLRHFDGVYALVTVHQNYKC